MTDEMIKNGMSFLTDKEILLSSPGFAVNDLYYSKADTIVETAECTYSHGRYQYSISGAAFGSGSQIIIPNSSFVGDTILYLELPPLTAGLSVGDGWAYNCVQSLAFLLGSSNVPQLIMNSQSIFELAMLECDTAEKRNNVIKLAGKQTSYSATGNNPVLRAQIVLPLPFSCLCGGASRKLLDTNLLSNQVIVSVNFNPSNAVYYTGGPGGPGIPPLNMNRAIAFLTQGDLSDKNESLRLLMRLNPEKSLNYPFVHHQSYPSAPFPGITEAQGGQCTIPLTGLINADLVAVSFHVMKQSDLSNGNYFNWYTQDGADGITNIQLLYNGLVVYNAPGEMYKLYNMGAGAIGSSSFNYNPAIADPTTNTVKYPVLINFSREKSVSFSNHYSNVWRLGNNTLTLSFNTPDNAQYVCFSTYHYNGLISISNGSSNITFS